MNNELNLPERFSRPKPVSFIITVIVLAFFFSSLNRAGINSENMQIGERLPIMIEFLKELFPPDFSRSKSMLEALLLTFQMAVVGTALGLVLSLPIGILASKNFSPHKSVYVFFRFLISLFRTIPDLVWALFFVITVGLGPLAGTLTLIVECIGFCGRFFAVALEEVETGPIQGLQALGANRLSVISCAALPAALPSFTNTALYSLEKAVRASVVLGLVGAGGIGIELKVAMDTFRYSQACAIIISIFVMVMIVERASVYIRSKIL